MTRIVQAIPAPPELYGVWTLDDGSSFVERVICLAVIDDGDDIVPIFIEDAGLTWFSYGGGNPDALFDHRPSPLEIEELAERAKQSRARKKEMLEEARRQLRK